MTWGPSGGALSHVLHPRLYVEMGPPQAKRPIAGCHSPTGVWFTKTSTHTGVPMWGKWAEKDGEGPGRVVADVQTVHTPAGPGSLVQTDGDSREGGSSRVPTTPELTPAAKPPPTLVRLPSMHPPPGGPPPDPAQEPPEHLPLPLTPVLPRGGGRGATVRPALCFREGLGCAAMLPTGDTMSSSQVGMSAPGEAQVLPPSPLRWRRGKPSGRGTPGGKRTLPLCDLSDQLQAAAPAPVTLGGPFRTSRPLLSSPSPCCSHVSPWPSPPLSSVHPQAHCA